MKGEVISLPIAKLSSDQLTQVRIKLNEKTVKKYERLYRDKITIDPVRAVYDGTSYHIYDGYHRIAAAKRAGMEYIQVALVRGTLAEARWLACAANARHGKTMDQADRRRAIRLAFASRPEGVPPTWRSIATHVGVDHHTVQAVAIRDYIKEHDTASDADVADYFSRLGFTCSANVVADARGKLVRVTGTATTDVPGTSATGEPVPSVCAALEMNESLARESQDEEEKIPLPPVPQKATRSGQSKPKEVMIRDALGQEIPDHLRDTFCDQRVRERLEQLEALAGALDAKAIWRTFSARDKAYPFMRFSDLKDHLDEAEHRLALAVQTIKDGLPYAICPVCKGKGELNCCCNAGCLPKEPYKAVLRGQG